jgi:Electron transfer DM13
MESFDDLQRAFFDGLYTNRIPIAIGSMLVAVVVVVIAWRAGWLAAARRHPGRSGLAIVVALAIGLPVTWYLASPIWVRTELNEPEPATEVAVVPSPTPMTGGHPAPTPSERAAPPASASPTPATFVARTVASGEFHGTDDFHFGRGTARIVETAPGSFVLRLAEFSVRNGPDLYVYLSPDAADYDDAALELGKLKATDGSFGYGLPPGTDPADFASAIIWCKQFSHLFAVAPLSTVARSGHDESQVLASVDEARTLRP